MKKRTFIVALLAVVSMAFVAFSKNRSSVPAEEKKQSYTWIKYNCGSWGTASVYITPTGVNGIVVSGTSGFPSSWLGNPNFDGCIQYGSAICAIRFSAGEFEPIPGHNGQIRPKANVNPWDGLHMMAYCY